MKESPILFTPANYQAILDGSKTQTRRIVKPEPPEWVKEFGCTCFTPAGLISGRGNFQDKGTAEKFFKSPFGMAGDRLWVREGLEINGGLGVRYRRDGQNVGNVSGEYPLWQWQRDTLSPIHMPKWAARLWLEIVEVRVHRLQEISKEDAIAEGVQPISGHPYSWKSYRFGKGVASDVHCEQTARDSYRTLWESINGAGSWDTNPWVWAISFKRVTA